MLLGIIKTTILTAILATSLYSSQKTYGDTTVSQVTSIYDGDTFRANIDSFPPIVGKKMSIRISGIDTPEMRGKCQKEKLLARQAKQHTVNLLRNAKTIKLKNLKRGKYFRIVADVYTDNISIGESLIKNNLAVRYDGGKKSKDWCR